MLTFINEQNKPHEPPQTTTLQQRTTLSDRQTHLTPTRTTQPSDGLASSPKASTPTTGGGKKKKKKKPKTQKNPTDRHLKPATSSPLTDTDESVRNGRGLCRGEFCQDRGVGESPRSRAKPLSPHRRSSRKARRQQMMMEASDGVDIASARCRAAPNSVPQVV